MRVALVVVLLVVAASGAKRDDPVGRVTSYSRGGRCGAPYFLDSVRDENCHQLLCAPFANSSVVTTCSFFPPPKNVLLPASIYEYTDSACQNLTHVTRFGVSRLPFGFRRRANFASATQLPAASICSRSM